jgi:hypothetical protein
MRSTVPCTDEPPLSPAKLTLTASVFSMRAGVPKPITVPSARFTSNPILVIVSVLVSLSDDIVLVSLPSHDKVSVSGSAQASWIVNDTTTITGPSGYKDSIVELGDAFDNQTHGDESRNPKIDWHGADSFRRTARCHQQTSSRLSQTHYWTRNGVALGCDLTTKPSSRIFNRRD